MKYLLSLLLLLGLSAVAQNSRYDGVGGGNNARVAVCSSPANGVPCTNYATTYNSLGVACSNSAQDTPQPQPSNCQATVDSKGAVGFWAPAGTYDYTVCAGGSCSGPYTVTLGSSASGECAEGTCIRNAPAGDQAIAGSHQLINRGVEHVGVDLSGLSAFAQSSLGALPHYVGESHVFHPSSATSVGFSVWDEAAFGVASYQASYGTGQRTGNEGDSYTISDGDTGIGVYGYSQVNSNSALNAWGHYSIATSAATAFSPGGTVAGVATGYYADANSVTLVGSGVSAGFFSKDQGVGAHNYGFYSEGGRFRVDNTPVPASAGAAGTKGEIAWDSGFVYICVATNTWKRVEIATW